MKKSFILSLIFLPIAAFAGPNIQEWEKRYVGLSKIIRARNFNGFSALVADDLVWVQADGKSVGRAEALKEFAPMFKATKITGGEKVLKVTQRGALVDVNYETNLVITYKGKKPEPYHEKGVDTWKKVHGRWLITRSVTEPEKKPG